MALTGSLVSAGIGLLGGVLGGGGSKTPSFVAENYKLQNSLWKKALDLYNQTNLETQDAQTLALYNDGAMQRAMGLLQNYDATRAGASGRIGAQDTQLSRGRGQIASDTAQQVSQLGAQLSSTRPQRKAALLPSAAGASSGFQSAAFLDQAEQQRQQAEMNGLFGLAPLIGQLLTKKKGAGTPGTNDAYGAIYGNKSANLNLPDISAVLGAIR